MRITYVGHATLLLEIGSTKLLTDPNFDASLGRFLPRVSAPGIRLEDLPALDAMLLTHAHADHLSFGSLRKLPTTIPLYAPREICDWLKGRGVRNAVPIGAGEQIEFAGTKLRLHAERATHRGNRYGFDRWRSAANMYLIENDEESIFFAGDTALTGTTHSLVENVLGDLKRRLDIALLPIGWAPSWKPGFRRGHLTGEDALTLFERLNARAMVPYHWGTFRHVTATAFDAIDRLRARLEEYAGRENVHVIKPGESLNVDPTRAWRS